MLNSKISEIQGWMAEVELLWLYNTAQKVPDNGLIIEIGAWKGRSTAALYQGAGNTKTVITIDTWKGSLDEMPVHAEAKTTDLLAVFLENMNSLSLNPKLLSFPIETGSYYLQGDSVECADLFPDKSVDWIFIDGDHHRCGEDIDAWLPKMKDNGIMTGHDYFCFYKTIQQEIHKRFYINEIVHSIWIKHIEG